MDRRSFLTLLGAVGVLTGAPKWLLDPVMREKLAPDIELTDDDDVSAWLAPRDLAVYGRRQTFEFYAAHTGDIGDGIALARMARLPEDGGETLLEFALGPGVVIQWRADIGDEIRGPVRIIVPELVQAHVVGTDARGRVVCASKDGVFPINPALA